MKYLKEYDEFTNEGLKDFLNLFNPFYDPFEAYNGYIFSQIANYPQYRHEAEQILTSTNVRENMLKLVRKVYNENAEITDLIFNSYKFWGDVFNPKRQRRFIRMGEDKFMHRFINEYAKITDQDLKKKITADLIKYKSQKS